MIDKPLCQASTAAGERCRKAALDGLRVCATHNGAAVGRPTKLDEELASRICQVLRAGGYVETAAQVAGVARARLSEWMRRGDPAGTDARNAPYRRFRERVEAARAESETRYVALIARSSADNWQAAAWLLERTYPERWARPSQRPEVAAPATPAASAPDPFAEVDELASRRRRGA